MNKKPISDKQRQQRVASGKAAKAKQTPKERMVAAKHATSIQWADRAEPPSNAVEIIQEACENGCTHEQIATALGSDVACSESGWISIPTYKRR
jgi:hypothetical protein